MRTSLKVIPASTEHLDEAAVLFNEYRIFYQQESDIEGAKQFIVDRLNARESVIFLVIDIVKHKAIGFTQLYPSYSSVSMKRIWILNDLYIVESYRNQGAAKLLLEAAKSHALQTKAKGIALSTAVDNFKAQKLYESSGYSRDMEYYHYFLSV